MSELNLQTPDAGELRAHEPSTEPSTERPSTERLGVEELGNEELGAEELGAEELGAEELGAELRAAIARIYRRFRSERAEGELGDAAISVLTQLLKNGPLTLTDLSEGDRVTPGSMSQTVNRLAAGGYVVRKKDASDGRRVLIETTPEGQRVAAEARAHREGWFNGKLAEFSSEERAVLARAAALISRVADS